MHNCSPHAGASPSTFFLLRHLQFHVSASSRVANRLRQTAMHQQVMMTHWCVILCLGCPLFTQPCGTSESQLASVSYTHHPGSSRVGIFYPSPNNDEPSDFSIYIYKIYCCIYIIYVK